MNPGDHGMHITSDWQIHSTNSYDGHLPMSRLIEQASEKGVIEFGVADHLSTPIVFWAENTARGESVVA